MSGLSESIFEALPMIQHLILFSRELGESTVFPARFSRLQNSHRIFSKAGNRTKSNFGKSIVYLFQQRKQKRTIST